MAVSKKQARAHPIAGEDRPLRQQVAVVFTMNTMLNTRGKQISVRIPAELDEWLQSKAVGGRGKADIVRSLIARARRQEMERELFCMFEEAAKDWDDEDRREQELWERASLEDFRRSEEREQEK